MPDAIAIERLGKQYRLGELSRPTRITEAAVDTARRIARRPGRGARVGREDIWALRGIDLDVPEGQALGVVGRNGSGKSTLLKVLARITDPSEGRVTIHGRVGALIELGTGFHPELTGRENVYLNGAILGMSRAEIRRKFDTIAAFSEVEQFLDTPMKRYSSGMRIRLAFAVAAHLEPDILLIDEVLAVGDAEFQRRCLGRMDEIRQSGRTLLFVSHNSNAIESLCERAIWLEQGSINYDGAASDTVRQYLRNRARLAEATWQPPSTGDPDLECREIRLLSGDGSSKVDFDRSEPIVVEFDIVVRRLNPRLRIGFDLANQEGLIAFASAHVDVPAFGDAPLQPGRHVLRAEIPALLLNHGLYSLHARLGVHQIRWIIHEDDVLQLEVKGAEGELGERPGIVLPNVAWTGERTATEPKLASSV